MWSPWEHTYIPKKKRLTVVVSSSNVPEILNSASSFTFTSNQGSSNIQRDIPSLFYNGISKNELVSTSTIPSTRGVYFSTSILQNNNNGQENFSRFANDQNFNNQYRRFPNNNNSVNNRLNNQSIANTGGLFSSSIVNNSNQQQQTNVFNNQQRQQNFIGIFH